MSLSSSLFEIFEYRYSNEHGFLKLLVSLQDCPFCVTYVNMLALSSNKSFMLIFLLILLTTEYNRIGYTTESSWSQEEYEVCS